MLNNAAPSIEDVLIEVDQASPWMHELLAKLVDIPTVEETRCAQDLVESELVSLGLEVSNITLDEHALHEHPEASPFDWSLEGKRNVVGRWPGRGTGGRSLLLNGHIDVVPASSGAELWSRSPFNAFRQGDWMYGRGSADMKAGLVASLGALRALKQVGWQPASDLLFESVVEEESSGNGTLQNRIRGVSADACVVTEPFNSGITLAQLGVLWFKVRVVGYPVHAQVAAEQGFNAIEVMSKVTASLRVLESELNDEATGFYRGARHPINLNPGVIQGGDWPSTVAAECTCSYRLATFPGQPLSDLRARIVAAVDRVASEHSLSKNSSPKVEFLGIAAEGSELSTASPIVEAVASASGSAVGRELETVAINATTDARILIQAGIPTVVFGPYGENIHGIDERVSLSSMVEVAKTLAVLAHDWCSAEQ